MDAIVLRREDGGTNTLAVESVPTPTPERGEVRIRVEHAGICGSDVGAYLGKEAYDFVSTPRVLGHEYAGVVDAVGEGVTDVAVGDHVVERPLRACGRCRPCRTGRTNVCESVRITGFHHDGAFASHVVAPSSYVHHVPDDVSLGRAALVEPMAVAARATLVRGDVTAGDSVLVSGPGPMGAFSALLARASGADVTVTGLARDRTRLDALARAGVRTVDVTDVDAASFSSAVGESFDVVVDATGAAAAVETNVAAAANGGRVVLVGIPSAEMHVPGYDFVRAEKSLVASYGATASDMERVLDLLSTLDGLSEVVTTDYSPTEPTEAFDAFTEANVIKPVLKMGELN